MNKTIIKTMNPPTIQVNIDIAPIFANAIFIALKKYCGEIVVFFKVVIASLWFDNGDGFNKKSFIYEVSSCTPKTPALSIMKKGALTKAFLNIKRYITKVSNAAITMIMFLLCIVREYANKKAKKNE